ncbi:TcpQ domain-containing protein [Pantoea agglomerans]|uniref:TcpQ domain-containing protein n=1 Tax=Enterobacter agglomerans TaxID=549 RepID=UPI00177E963E|nr:TcpQ domain-containing protein [Pantoea agglomerans]MBD8145913.1 TcpQ domain-containing protein [Pantoea agglomerans]WVL82695.1 TcpQ domain-containing protein [Pantoea agglomerans]WVL87912.1 TcpQ domain-containing protein [Pantoea agglomerans]
MSIIERAGLFPALFLTGCAQQAVITGPPSGSVVDGMLSRSAADISAMQYRIHQSSPSAQRPVSSASVKSSVPLLSRPTVAPASLLKPSGPPLPSATAGAGPADGFVRQSGVAPTLRAALHKIVPPGHTVVFDRAVSADAPELWQWTGNDRWPFVIDKLLATRGMKATVNEKTGTVTVEPAQRAQTTRVPDKGTSSPVPAAGPIKPVPAAAPDKPASSVPVKTVTQTGTGLNPFRGDATAKAAGAAIVPVSPAATKAPVVPVIPPKVIQVRHWRIETGSTVKDWLYSQAAIETCTVPGIKNWTVAWLTPTNYRVDAPLTFDGSFREMLNRLFTLYGTAKVPLYAGVRAAQCVVSVDDKEVQ